MLRLSWISPVGPPAAAWEPTARIPTGCRALTGWGEPCSTAAGARAAAYGRLSPSALGYSPSMEARCRRSSAAISSSPPCADSAQGSCSPLATARLLAKRTRCGAGTKESRSHRAKTAASSAVTSVRVMNA
ncbi:hypothetical protein VR46_07560 [Streptomyces sp. NRRL S-444]|nr:hypothetical protein VR46_07560 [Streptomyces sp. NRRL S-444]